MTAEERVAQLEAEVRSLRLIAEGLTVALQAANLRLQQEGNAAQVLASRREAARVRKQNQRAMKRTEPPVSRDSVPDLSTGQTRDNDGTPPSSFPSSFPPSSEPSSSYPLSFPPSPKTSLAASPEAEKPSELRALWNAEADPRLPRWKDLTDKRAKQAAARLSERPLAEWRIILGRINASPFCLGENERGWKADVEFFLRPDTATRVLEGKYDPSVRPGAKHVLPKADDPGWVTS